MPVSLEWIRGLPKVELHTHLESMSQDLILDLADAAGVQPPRLTEPRGLDNLLRYLDEIGGLVRSRADATRVAYWFARRAHESGVRYQEVILNPFHWREHWSGRLGELVDGLDAGFAEAEDDGLTRSRLTVSILRPRPRQEAYDVLDELIAAAPSRVVAFSVDGNETAAGLTGAKFAPVFAKAADAGFRRTVHTGESGGPEHIRDSLEYLMVERIDHGFRAAEDPALVDDIRDRGLTLNLCPSQNLAMGWYESLSEHPMEALRAAGVKLTINTDSPFSFSLAEEYDLCAREFGWDKAVLRDLARNSITASFAPESERAALLAELERFPD